ncbi:MAG: glycerophosphodiester phosphodiesterase family protein [Candidatus Thalassarchaeaceae archaeon]|nr:glycerophosphodiester phosphodiesterase family protein [Candidatus Thalassarchaeaceae archaeon]
MGKWKQPGENSIEALQHGVTFGDGVEFDLRIDGDGELVIFHDEFATGESPILERCVENLPTDYLRSTGVPTLNDLLANREFTDSWQSGGKTVDIEFKLPHPSTKIDTMEYLSSIMGKLEESLEPLDLPDRSVVVSCFSPKIGEAAKTSGFSMPVIRLMPHIRAWGRFWRMKRVVAVPHFARTTVKGITRDLRKEGMESIGMALDYLVGWPRFIHPGIPVGLRGRGLKRFFEYRQGMGAFIWPAPLKHEDALINAGASLVSDDMDPTVLVKPDGTPRWPRPASQPLDEEWSKMIDGADPLERGDIMHEAFSSLPKWGEIGGERKRGIIEEQAKRMLWPGSTEKWVRLAEEGLPWGSPRIIGHRGAGSTHGV